MTPDGWMFSLEEAEAKLPDDQAAFRFWYGLRPGTMKVGLYAPTGSDTQGLHKQDELYIVVRGTSDFIKGEERRRFVRQFLSEVELRPARRDEATALSALCMRSKAFWGYDHLFMEACRQEFTLTAEYDPERELGSGMGSMQGNFRRAQQADVSVVGAISAEAYVAAYVPIIGVAPVPAHENYGRWIDDGEVWLAVVEDKPSGVLVLRRSPDHLFVYSVAVVSSGQGRGLGTALLALAEQRAVEAGLPELRLYTNRRMERNVRLYRRCGFVEVGERPHPSRPGEILVDMVKAVTEGPEGRRTPT